MFSETEEKILKILGNKKMSITEVAEKFFKTSPPTLNPNATISGTVIHINKKCKFHKLTWTIDGEGMGRKGKTIWIRHI